jgi:hypothetical protein
MYNYDKSAYNHRKYRVKVKVGYGAEGALVGKTEIGSWVQGAANTNLSPREETYEKSEAKEKARANKANKHKTNPND